MMFFFASFALFRVRAPLGSMGSICGLFGLLFPPNNFPARRV